MDIHLVDEAEMPQVWNLWVRGLREHAEAFGADYEWALEVSAEESQDILRQIRSSGGFIFGAFEDENPIGMLHFNRQQGAKFRHKGEIGAVYVVPEQRGKGIAQLLLHAALEDVRKQDGIVIISLSVISENKTAQWVYQSSGFQVYGVEPKGLCVDGKYFDLVHMTREVGK